jgi:hypothetical protein
MTSPVVGNRYFVELADGSKKPVRKRPGEKINVGEITEPIKHFWAMVVYNYDAQDFQILEISQKTIQNQIMALINNAKWGNPKQYDLVIKRSGEKLDTDYQVIPQPKQDLEPAIKEGFEGVEIDLTQLYSTAQNPYGGDPYKNNNTTVDPNEVPSNIG